MALGALDWGVFRRKEAWQAFAISVVLFAVIAFTALHLFGISGNLGARGDLEPALDFEVQTLNRTGIEEGVVGPNGTFRLSEHRGEVVVIDFTSIECLNCKFIAAHIKENRAEWAALEGPHRVTIISIEAWYAQYGFTDVEEVFGNPDDYRYKPWTVGYGSDSSVYLTNNTTADIGFHYKATAPPVVYVIDHEGWIVHRHIGYEFGEDFADLDNAIIAANKGEAQNLRFGIGSADDSTFGLFVLGLLLGVLVYFSPCAFPVLPGYISYYLALGTREDELIEEGKLKGRMPRSFVIGLLAGLGMLTFFLVIGIIVYTIGRFIPLTGMLTFISYAIAVLLIILGAFMLVGGTAHLMGFVQKWIQKWQTTETDDHFTPRRNMYLYGVGYAAASIDCTAAAVLPFLAVTMALGTSATIAGMSGLMVSVVFLMTAVTSIVGAGRAAFVDFLRHATGIIKLTGAWMMMFAGIGLISFLSLGRLQLST